MTTTIAYRDSLEGARLRYADLLSRAGEGSSFAAASRVYAARTGRVWAGVAGLAGFGLMVLSAAGALRLVGLALSPTLLLCVSWLAMVFAYAAGSSAGARRVARAAMPRESGDLHADLARLEEAAPLAMARALAEQRTWDSTAVPMMAVGLLAPLSIHLVVATLLGMVGAFDTWIQISLVVVGHAHLALAVCYWRFATRAVWIDDATLRADRSRMEWKAFGIVVGISALPGAALYLIPPVLTAVTALVFHPLVFRGMTRTLLDERAALA